MNATRILGGGLLLGIVMATAPVEAGPHANARVFLHLTSPTLKACDKGGVPQERCAGTRTNGSLYPATWFAHLLVCQADYALGVGGLQCGIAYDAGSGSGVDVFAWRMCATLEFPSSGWPASGGGNRIAWETLNRCQRSEPWGAGSGVVAVAGYFYCAAYGDDLLRIVPRPEDGRITIVDCDGREETLAPTPLACALGAIRFSAGGGAEGVNPCCCAVSTRETSWSALKRLYGLSGSGRR